MTVLEWAWRAEGCGRGAQRGLADAAETGAPASPLVAQIWTPRDCAGWCCAVGSLPLEAQSRGGCGSGALAGSAQTAPWVTSHQLPSLLLTHAHAPPLGPAMRLEPMGPQCHTTSPIVKTTRPLRDNRVSSPPRLQFTSWKAAHNGSVTSCQAIAEACPRRCVKLAKAQHRHNTSSKATDKCSAQMTTTSPQYKQPTA